MHRLPRDSRFAPFKMTSPIAPETASSRRIAAQAILVSGAVALAFGVLGLYENKPAAPDDGVLVSALLVVFAPPIASFLSNAFCIAVGLAALLFGFLRYRGKA